MFKRSICTAAALAAFAGVAQADVTILSFTFSDLSGGYTAGNTRFNALGVNVAPLQSQGDVSRVNLPSPGSASYSTPGSAAGKVNVDLLVSVVVPNSTANGTGTITIFDADGDTLQANVSGQFINNGVSVFFNGSLSNVGWTDNGVQDGLFNGPSGGSIPLSFSPAPPPYTGAIVQLFIGQGGNFFVNDFSGVSTQVSGVVVPSPATIALLGLGGLVAGRRRRH